MRRPEITIFSERAKWLSSACHRIFCIALIFCAVYIALPTTGVAATSPTQEQLDLDFADGLYQRKMYETAAKQYANFLDKYPTSQKRQIALFRRGESLYQHSISLAKISSVQSNVALIQARQCFQDLIKTAPDGEKIHDALLRHGEICYKLDTAGDGLPSLLRVIQESKDQSLLAAAIFYAARSHEKLNQNQDAEKRYRQILKSYKDSEYAAFSAYLLAELLLASDRNQEAAEILNNLWQNPSQYTIPEDSTLIEDAQLRAAQTLYRMDKFAEAAKAYEAYIATSPSGENIAKAKYGAAWAQYRRREFAKALEIAKTLQRQSLPPDLAAGILFLQGTCAYQQNQYDEAIRYFREVIADPNAGEYRDRGWYQLAWSYYLSEQYPRALRESQNLLKQPLATSMSANLHYLMGKTLAQLEQFERAYTEMQFVLELDPKSDYAEEALFEGADALYRLQRYEESAALFERSYKTYPNSNNAADALSWAVNAFFAAKNYSKAIEMTTLLLDTFPAIDKREDFIYRKALAHYQLKQYKEALAELDRILKAESSEKKGEALYWTAYLFEIQQDRKRAAETYERLLKEYPNFPNRDEIRLRKALCDYQEKNYPSAFADFHAILKTPTGAKLPSEVIFWMVLYAADQGDTEDALQICERILTVFDAPPILERARIARGNQLVALKRWDETLENAEIFLKQFPDSKFKPEILWTSAKANEGIGKQEEALRLYESSLLEMQKLGNPDMTFEAALYTDRGRLLQQMERYEDALESFLRVAIIFDHPELTPEAMYHCIACHFAVGEKAEALTIYNELEERYEQSKWYKKAQLEFAERFISDDGDEKKQD